MGQAKVAPVIVIHHSHIGYLDLTDRLEDEWGGVSKLHGLRCKQPVDSAADTGRNCIRLHENVEDEVRTEVLLRK